MPAWHFTFVHSPYATSQSNLKGASHHIRCSRIECDCSRRLVQRQTRSTPSTASNSWPKTASYHDRDTDYRSKVSIEQVDQGFYDIESRRFQEHCHCPSSSKPPFPLIRRPPQCRLPMSARFASLILYITVALLFIPPTAFAAPAITYHSHPHLFHNRQAIPDKTGQTGNQPAPVKSASLEVPASPSATPCLASPKATSTNTTSPSSEPTPFTPGPGNEGNTNAPPGQVGFNPGPPIRPLALVSFTSQLTPGIIAGIAGGGAVLLCILIAIGIWAWRRRRVDVNEIPIRRSKLISRLGFRVFDDKPASRSASPRDSHISNGSKASWLDKGTIGRPKPAWLENGLLSVPKTTFEGRIETEERAPWVDGFKQSIGRPMPSRPRSAEPLGRLSGMGMGMGYLK